MLRLTTLMTLMAATSMLTGCGRDAPTVTPDEITTGAELPVDDVQPSVASQDDPSEQSDPLDPGLIGSCGVPAPAVEFEVLDAPAAGTLTNLRLRWPSDAQMPAWDCCPYQHVLGAFVRGGDLIDYQEGSDDAGRFMDVQIAVDDAPGAELKAGLSVCSTHVTQSWTIAPSPFAETAAALAACEPIEDDVSFRDHEDAELRIANFAIDGQIEPGATIELQVGITEVSGLGHGYYPGLIFTFDPPVVELNETAGMLYAIFGCQEVPFTLPVTLPADLEPGTTLTITAQAGEPLCRDGDCRINDAASLTRRVMPAP